MKKALMITYDFPPSRTSGIYRPVKFIKHLREFRWEPIVLTSQNPYVEAYDYTLLEDIPEGVKIYRAISPDLARIVDAVYDFLFRSKSLKGSEENEKTEPAHVDEINNKAADKGSFRKTVLRAVNSFIENWIYLPDSKISWFPFAFFKAIYIVLKDRPDVIYSTSSPPTAQLVGFALRLIFRKPWIVDLRDNWVLNNDMKLIKSDIRWKLDLWILGKIVKKADQVITMCEGNAADLIVAYGDSMENKYQAITNGFDKDDFRDIAQSERSEPSIKLTMLHMGTLYLDSDGLFLKAVAELAAERPDIIENLEIDFIGYLNYKSAAAVEKFGLNKYIRLLGFKSHPEAVKAMMESDVLLMFIGASRALRRNYPGKFFEYLYCKKTILTFGLPGEIGDAIKKSEAGILVNHDDTRKIKDTIIDLYQKKSNGQLEITPNETFIESFEYKNLTGRLAEVLDKAYSK